MAFRFMQKEVKPEKMYKILTGETKGEVTTPKFVVSLKHSTLNKDFDKQVAELKKPQNNNLGVTFKIQDNQNLEIGIVFTSVNSLQEADRLFRNCLGVVNRYELKTSDLQAILSEYDSYLKKYGYKSACTPDSSQLASFRPMGNAY